jgi:L-alanine-DL-glutamate epimerase-like enolase superfamily enzyme
MEDLLTPEQAKGLAYLDGPPPRDPVERVARKAAWVLRLPEGFKAIKLKIGRSRWMRSPAEADARDVAVTHAVRAAIGPDVKLFADGNKDYGTRPESAAAYAEAVRATNVTFLEQMFADTEAASLRQLRLSLRAAKNPVRLAGGESEVGGLPEAIYTQRVGAEPLLDIDQADMGRNGFLHIREKAAAQRALAMTFAPHNFGSKLGFWAQVHLGLVVPNWEASEVDDVNFPALHAEGFVVRDGVAKITGQPGLGVRLDAAALGTPTIDLKT